MTSPSPKAREFTAKRITERSVDLLMNGYEVANFYCYPSGWQMVPYSTARQPSRKYWPTIEQAAARYPKEARDVLAMAVLSSTKTEG